MRLIWSTQVCGKQNKSLQIGVDVGLSYLIVVADNRLVEQVATVLDT
jgi:hypothetical protein